MLFCRISSSEGSNIFNFLTFLMTILNAKQIFKLFLAKHITAYKQVNAASWQTAEFQIELAIQMESRSQLMLQ